MRNTRRGRWLNYESGNSRNVKKSSHATIDYDYDQRRYSKHSPDQSLVTFQWQLNSMLSVKKQRKKAQQRRRMQTIADSGGCERGFKRNTEQNENIKKGVVNVESIMNRKQNMENNSSMFPKINPYSYNQSPMHYNQSMPIDRNYPMDVDPYGNQQNMFKPKKRYHKILRKPKNKRRLRAVFLAVAFGVFLKNFSKKVMKKRKQVFSSYWPTALKDMTLDLKKELARSNKKFFLLLLQNQDQILTLQEDDDKQQKEFKTESVKAMVKIFAQGIQSTFDKLCGKSKFLELLHTFCKHGAYLQNNVLTPDEVQRMSISEKHTYLRADSNLEKVQIITFLLIKIVLFQMILQPWRLDVNNFKKSKTNLMKNFYFLSGVLYHLLLQIQDSLIQKAKKNGYQVGNWRYLDEKIECGPSLVYPGMKYEKDQLISGLLSLKDFQKLFGPRTFVHEKRIIQELVTSLHKKMLKYHNQFIMEMIQGVKPSISSRKSIFTTEQDIDFLQ